jgi:hypothetical protein
MQNFSFEYFKVYVSRIFRKQRILHLMLAGIHYNFFMHANLIAFVFPRHLDLTRSQSVYYLLLRDDLVHYKINTIIIE